MCSPAGADPGSGGLGGLAGGTSGGSGADVAAGGQAPTPPRDGGSGGGGGGSMVAPGMKIIGALADAYGRHQNWKAQQYVDDVHEKLTKENADISLAHAREDQNLAEIGDKTAESLDLMTSRVNALRTRSSLRVAAGESGVTGTTPNDILTDAERIQATREGVLQLNYESRRRQRISQRRGISNSYLTARAGANTPFRPYPVNFSSVGFEIAGHTMAGYNDYQEANRSGASRVRSE